jgi:hypothetical protein
MLCFSIVLFTDVAKKHANELRQRARLQQYRMT